MPSIPSAKPDKMVTGYPAKPITIDSQASRPYEVYLREPTTAKSLLPSRGGSPQSRSRLGGSGISCRCEGQALSGHASIIYDILYQMVDIRFIRENKDFFALAAKKTLTE